MLAKHKTLMFVILLAFITLGNKTVTYAQVVSQFSQTEAAQKKDALEPALSKALQAAQQGNFKALLDTQNNHYDQDNWGSDFLKYLTDTRFDPNVKVRRDALYFAQNAGCTEDSLLFVLPMLDDTDAFTADSAAFSITDGRRSSKQFRRLDADQVVQLVKNASARNPEIVRHNPKILILLSQFKQNVAARSLVSQLTKANHWDASTAAANPVAWDDTLVIALVARCQIGSIAPAQVEKVLRANPVTRLRFFDYVCLMTDEVLLRYALSQLYDATLVLPGDADTAEGRICRVAASGFSAATKISLKFVMKDGVPQYDPKAIAKLYEFYGLKM